MEPNFGTPLSSADIESGKVFSVSYEPRLEYAWDTGPAIGRYLQELKNGRLVGRNRLPAYARRLRRLPVFDRDAETQH